jgi:CRP/FNR family transcriptional regulator
MNLEEKYNFIKSVIRHINKDINEEALDFFVKGLTEKNLDKNKIFIDNQKKHNEIGFIVKGLIRGYYIDTKGNEINTRFLNEGGFATHYKAFIEQEPSNFFFKTVEPTQLLCFSYIHIQNCYRNFPHFEKFGRLMAEAIIIKMDERLESLHFDNAEKRYYDFIQKYPDLHNRLSLEQISSYIRISRPALSRLRSKKL